MGTDEVRKRAIFLDRDGVITALAFNPGTDQWESPHHPGDARLLEGAAEAIKSLTDSGYLVFVVSNQPSYAKGKTSIENIRAIHEKIAAELAVAGAAVTEFYYCYHHPAGDKPGYSCACECRKPKPYFLLKAAEKYGLDMAESWMVGDRETDMECGATAGVRTVFVKSLQDRGKYDPHMCEASVKNLKDAVVYILSCTS